MQYAVGRQLLGDVAVRRTAEADDERFDSRCEKMGLDPKLEICEPAVAKQHICG